MCVGCRGVCGAECRARWWLTTLKSTRTRANDEVGRGEVQDVKSEEVSERY
jgi:hypothetical protein